MQTSQTFSKSRMSAKTKHSIRLLAVGRPTSMEKARRAARTRSSSGNTTCLRRKQKGSKRDSMKRRPKTAPPKPTRPSSRKWARDGSRATRPVKTRCPKRNRLRMKSSTLSRRTRSRPTRKRRNLPLSWLLTIRGILTSSRRGPI